jgi:DEAD/DEAH box helicase domain-containing protein
MNNDVLVFDIETQNFFTDLGVGWNNFGALKISVVGVYSYNRDEYSCYEEDQMEELAVLFSNAKTIVGFSSNRYDVPVLNLYFNKLKKGEELDLWKKERIDLLEIIESATGKRISLNKLALANIGASKDSHGSEAIKMYAEGRMEELKKYCLKDVEITKKLYDLYIEQGFFMMPNRETGELERLELTEKNEKQQSSNGNQKTLF